MFKKFSVYLLSNVVSAAVPFLLLPILTSELTPRDFGLVALFQTLLNMSNALSGMSLSNGATVLYFKDETESFKSFVGSSFVTLLLTSAFFLILIPINNIFELGITSGLVVLIVISAYFFNINQVRMAILQAKGRAWAFSLHQVGQTVTNIVISILLVVTFQLKAEGRIWGISSGMLVLGGFSFLSLLFSEKIKIGVKSIKENFHWGLSLIPHVAGTLLLTTADRFLILKVLDEDSLGVFYVAIQLALPLLMFGTSFNNAFKPLIYDNLSKGNYAKCRKYSLVAVGSLIAIGVIYALCVWFIYPVIIDPQYAAARNLSLVLVVANIFQIAYYAASNYFFYLDKRKQISTITLITSILYIIAGFLALKFFGLLGLVYCYLIISVLFFLLVWFMGIHHLKKQSH